MIRQLNYLYGTVLLSLRRTMFMILHYTIERLVTNQMMKKLKKTPRKPKRKQIPTYKHVFFSLCIVLTMTSLVQFMTRKKIFVSN